MSCVVLCCALQHKDCNKNIASSKNVPLLLLLLLSVPQQELLLLLATGSTTPPLQSFLGSTFGEAGLRRLARAVDSTASGLHTALLERVMPLVELVLFLLGELRGLVVCGGGVEVTAGSWMGLQVSGGSRI